MQDDGVDYTEGAKNLTGFSRLTATMVHIRVNLFEISFDLAFECMALLRGTLAWIFRLWWGLPEAKYQVRG
jgi:hypothetical protein